MICCDNCNTWFHGRCVGVKKDDIESLGDWVCPRCDKTKLQPPRHEALLYISVDLDSENINEILDNLAQDEFEDLVDASNLLETSEEAADCERHPEVLRKDIFKIHTTGMSEREKRKVERRRAENQPEPGMDAWQYDVGIRIRGLDVPEEPSKQDEVLHGLLLQRKKELKTLALENEFSARRFAWLVSISKLQAYQNHLMREELPKEIITSAEITDLAKNSMVRGSSDVNYFGWAQTLVCVSCKGQIPYNDFGAHCVECSSNQFLPDQEKPLCTKFTSSFDLDEQLLENDVCGFCSSRQHRVTKGKSFMLAGMCTEGTRKRACPFHPSWKSETRKRVKRSFALQKRIDRQVQGHLNLLQHRLKAPDPCTDIKAPNIPSSWNQVKNVAAKMSDLFQREIIQEEDFDVED